MSGRYIKIVNPGYAQLWTRDLPYVVGSGESASLNPFDPNSARPLIEGEWLQRSGSSLTRGGNNVMASSGTPDGESTVPAFLYFNEAGRTDVQTRRLCHIIQGPVGFEVEVKDFVDTSVLATLAVNDALSVWDWDGPSGAWGLVRRVLAKQNTGWIVGRVSQILAANHVRFVFGNV